MADEIKPISARPVVTETGTLLLEMTLEGQKRPIYLGSKKISVVLAFKDKCEKYIKGELGEPVSIDFAANKKSKLAF